MMKYLILLTILFAFIGCDNSQEPLGMVMDNEVKKPSDWRPGTLTPPDEGDNGEIDVGEIDVGEIDVGEGDNGEIDVGNGDNGEIDVGNGDNGEIDVGNGDNGEIDAGNGDNGKVIEGAENLGEAQLGALLVFGKNDRIIVKNTLEVGLKIREDPNGKRSGGMFDGETGRIISEAEIEDGLVWFEIEWEAPVKNPDSGCGEGKKVCIGWSVAVLRDGTEVLDLLR